MEDKYRKAIIEFIRFAIYEADAANDIVHFDLDDDWDGFYSAINTLMGEKVL